MRSSEPTVVYKEPFVDEHRFFMNFSIREASIEETIALERIHTVAATYDFKILQL